MADKEHTYKCTFKTQMGSGVMTLNLTDIDAEAWGHDYPNDKLEQMDE